MGNQPWSQFQNGIREGSITQSGQHKCVVCETCLSMTFNVRKDLQFMGFHSRNNHLYLSLDKIEFASLSGAIVILTDRLCSEGGNCVEISK